jgi:pyruvate/2-oxoglutarate dehydrogenase complex dihydrolipoamide acyltransferase (E2) component
MSSYAEDAALLSRRRDPARTARSVIAERVEPRYMLDLTVAFDHDVVDGAPAARFVKRLVELIESGYGLEETRQTLAPRAASPG